MNRMIDQQLVAQVVQEVLSKLQTGSISSLVPPGSGLGVFSTMEEAIQAAHNAYQQLTKGGVEARKKAIQAIRRICSEKAEEFGRIEFEETRIGRLAHKVEKLAICAQLVPGVEFLTRDAYSGDHGLTVIEYTPWGVIGAVTPVTHSVPTLTGNAINMIAAGNTVVFNVHPGGARCAAIAVKAYNQAILEATGIGNILTMVEKPTLETFAVMGKSPLVRLLCVTGGPGVVKAAQQFGKRAICAGPGNPPVLVDEFAELDHAARCVIQGASYDNNLLCIGEKELFVVEKVADAFIASMRRAGAVQLNSSQIAELTKVIFPASIQPKDTHSHPVIDKKYVGSDAAVLAKTIGMDIPASTQLIFGETGRDHPFVVAEQMMSFLPVVRVRDFEEGIEASLEAEHGFKHTAIIHSLNVCRMTRMAQAMDTTLFIKNGPSMCGLGLSGEGFLSYSIATPTGEGVSTPMTFTRSRRCVMVDQLKIY